MKILYKFRWMFIAAGILLAGSGCQQKDTDGDKAPDEVDRCPTTTGPLSNHGCPVLPQIKKIHLYLDNSASMDGYYRSQTQYKTIVSDLAVKMDKEIRPVDITFIARTTIPYQKSITEFSNDLATTKMAAQKSSELPRMIKDIADHAGSNDISVLVSDCILSFSDTAVKANPEVNRDNAAGTLKNNIYTTFADLKQKGFAASIYAFQSRFFGTYYDYQNQKTKLSGTTRPFYIWVIAKKSLLLQFNARLDHISSFRPEKALHFGMVDQPLNNFTILPEMERKGDWSKSERGVSDVELPKGQILQIGTVLDLDPLPSYAKNDRYLQNNLLSRANGCRAQFEIRTKTEADKSKLHSEGQVRAFDAGTHELLIKISDMSLSKASVHFTLPLKYDTWYREWSSMNDKSIKFQSGKTFALEHLVTGVIEAYQTQDKNYIDFSLSLTK